MTAVIHFWHKNPLAAVIKNADIKTELEATLRRVFVPWAVYQLYTAPEHRCVILDEDGRWEDDGGAIGAGDRHADDSPGYLRSFDLC